MKNNKKIYLGKIYRVEDASGVSHPGKPYKAYRKKRKYDVIKFTTEKKKSYKLQNNIDSNSNKPCYVRKRPERFGDSYIKEEYPNYQVRNNQDKQTLKKVKRNIIKIWGKNK